MVGGGEGEEVFEVLFEVREVLRKGVGRMGGGYSLLPIDHDRPW